MAAYTITGTAKGDDTLTPEFTFPSGTIEVEVGGVHHSDLSTGVAGSIIVTTGQKVEYICSDWDAITGIELQNDKFNCDVGAWTLPTALTVLNLGSSFTTGFSGDIGSWVLPANLEYFDLSYTKMIGTVTDWVLPSTLVCFKIGVSSITVNMTNWDLSNCPNLETFYANVNSNISGDLSNWEFPNSFETLYLHAPSSISCSIANWDFSTTALKRLAIGTGGLSGDISRWILPASCVDIWFNNSAIDYDSTGGCLKDIISESIDINWDNAGLTYTQVDNILADLVTSGVANGEVKLDGTNSGPSSAGTASKNTLEADGWTVQTNSEIVFPTQASSPTPADSGTNIVVSTNLSWTKDAGDEVYVYLDKQIDHDPPTTKVVDNVDTGTYDPGNLDPGTTYVWRVDTTDGVLITTGIKWEFTTLAVPAKASIPTPANSGSDIGIATNLSWTKEATATVLVYFDKQGDHDPPTTKVVNDEDVSSYDPPVDLDTNTVYVWRVDTKNDSGTTTGDKWEFTTEVSAGGDSELSFNRGDARGIALGINRGVF